VHGFPKPFFRDPPGRWYVQLGGKQINFGRDREAACAPYRKRIIISCYALIDLAATELRVPLLGSANGFIRRRWPA
jgi:hypothetical protein